LRGFLVGIALFALAATASSQKAEQPVVKAGDEWQFVVWYTVPSTTPNRSWVITSVAPARIEGTENGEPLVLTAELNVLESPRDKLSNPKGLSFPLEVGKKWRYESDWLFKSKGSKGTFTSDVAVVGYEKIKVPAGEFDTFKLVAKSAMRGISGINSTIDAETTHTYWYAPAANAVVKSESRNPYLGPSTVELVSFRLQR
jgi:hypothetical protein